MRNTREKSRALDVWGRGQHLNTSQMSITGCGTLCSPSPNLSIIMLHGAACRQQEAHSLLLAMGLAPMLPMQPAADAAVLD